MKPSRIRFRDMHGTRHFQFNSTSELLDVIMFMSEKFWEGIVIGEAMFREMRRIKQQIPNEECIEILKTEPRGVLSVLGDDGYPYGIPMDHWYSLLISAAWLFSGA